MDADEIRKLMRQEIALAVKTLHEAAGWTEADEVALIAVRRTAETFEHIYARTCEAADAERATANETNPFAPDVTMSREAADFILRAMNGLLLEGYWPKGYDVEGRHGGEDGQEYDDALLIRAADTVGRDKIKNAELLRLIAEADAGAVEE